MSLWLDRLSGFICLLAGITLSLELVLPVSDWVKGVLTQCNLVFAGYFFIDVFVRVVFLRQGRHVWAHPLDLAVLLPLLTFLQLPGLGSLLSQLALLLVIIGRLMHLQRLFEFLKFKPVHTLIAGFGILIFIGSLLLSLPVSTTTDLPYIDTLFTAASAVCVTGLSSVDFGTSFTHFGHWIVLVLIQIGGIGFMTFTTLMAILMNQRLSHRDTAEMQASFMAFNRQELGAMVFSVFRYTAIIEAIGACILFFLWRGHFATWEEALFAAIFHAVSAFCNAGFSVFSDNLIPFQAHSGVLFTIGGLVFLGGIGFPVLFNVMHYFSRSKKVRFHLQTKLAVAMSLFLVVFGFLVIFISEYARSFSSFDLWDQISNAFFLSIVPRTAGFNAISHDTLHIGTVLFIMILMFIGASPSSTGGGIKTTTFGILMVSFVSTLRMQDKAEIWHRQIPMQTLLRASAIVIMGALTIMLFCFVLLYTEKNAVFHTVLFETVSAFSTVGLSLGLTPLLSDSGKGIIVLLMLIGRVGPFAAAVALASQKPKVRYAYPEEDILVA